MLSIVFLAFVSCTPAPETTNLQPGCDTAGTVLRDQVEDASRGYPYRFMIYLPPCYDAEAEPGYPIIYMIPGRSSGPEAWFDAGMGEIADALILAGEVPPFLLVTTENTNHNPAVADIFNDLLPFIEQTYNTIPNRPHRAVGGGSLGGIAAYRLVFQYPEIFASAGMFGSGIVDGENQQVADWLASATAANRPRVFMNVGEQDPLMLAQAEVMAEILDQAGVEYEFIIGEGAHSYDYWAGNLAEYFRWVAKDW